MNDAYSFRSLASAPRSLGPKPGWLELLLPPAVVPLLALFVLLLPIALLSAKSLLVPVLEWVQPFLIPVKAGAKPVYFSVFLMLKVLLFGLFSFLGVKLLVLKLMTTYIDGWSRSVEQAHPSHVAYHASPLDSLVALFNWNLYRWLTVLGPLVLSIAVYWLCVSAGLWTFDWFGSFIPLMIQFTLGIFTLGVTSFLIVLNLCVGIKRLFQTLLGDIIAVTEPELPAELVHQRAQTLMMASPWSTILIPSYAVFYLVVVIELVVLFTQFRIQSLLQFSPELLTLYVMNTATIAVFVVLNAMKFLAYHDGLTRFYQKQRL